MVDIYRKPTEDEKRDFTDIGPTRIRTPKENFLIELAKYRLEAAKKRIPFFKKAAMDEFDEYFKVGAAMSLRKHGYVDPGDFKPISIDWDKYSSPDKIKFVDVSEVRDANLSKRHPFDVFFKSFRYKYEGYGEDDGYNMSVMEDETSAVKRARALFDNKKDDSTSLAETQSFLYGNKEAKVIKAKGA